MARFKRKAKRYSGFKRGAKRANSSSSGMKVTDVLIAGVIYGVARPMVAGLIPDLFKVGPVTSDNVIIGAAGFYGLKKGKGITKALGVMALGGEAAQVTAGLLNGGASSTGSGIYTTSDSY
jgi:hypothetical protein